VQQFVSVLNHSGETLSTVKYHEGFMGQRIAPVTCIAFHPIQVLCTGSFNLSVIYYIALFLLVFSFLASFLALSMLTPLIKGGQSGHPL